MYSYLMLSTDDTTRKEREETVLELVSNDPEVSSISMKRVHEQVTAAGRRRSDVEEKWDVLKGAEKAKFWKVCEWFYFRQMEFDKVQENHLCCWFLVVCSFFFCLARDVLN